MELTGKAKIDFENWAIKHENFHITQYLKILCYRAVYFKDLVEPFQLTTIITWLDSVKIWVIVNPVDNPNWWTFKILMPDIMAEFNEAYKCDLDIECTSRFEATKLAIIKSLEIYNNESN